MRYGRDVSTNQVPSPTKPCRLCGKPFIPARRDARYCSGACRQQAYRYRQEARERADTTLMVGRPLPLFTPEAGSDYLVGTLDLLGKWNEEDCWACGGDGLVRGRWDAEADRYRLLYCPMCQGGGRIYNERLKPGQACTCCSGREWRPGDHAFHYLGHAGVQEILERLDRLNPKVVERILVEFRRLVAEAEAEEREATSRAAGEAEEDRLQDLAIRNAAGT